VTLHLTIAGSGDQLHVDSARLVVAGYTARDQEAVARHIAELAEIGVAPPPRVPMFYDLDPALLTTDAAVEVPGSRTSGEVEPVLIRAWGRWFLGVGSDHTDRALERDDVAASKAACPKPLGPVVVPMPEDLDAFDIDRVAASSTVDGVEYQSAMLAELLRPAEVVGRLREALGEEVLADRALVIFGGTTPLLGGEFVYGTHWVLSLRLPDGTELAHHYDALVKGTLEEKR
jgi:4-hydroxyphenylacetate 3-monooxygenase